MTRYYFDLRDNGTLIEDDIGHELLSVAAAKTEATATLAEIARDVLPGSVVRTLSLEVRDAVGPVLTAMLRFQVDEKAASSQPKASNRHFP